MSSMNDSSAGRAPDATRLLLLAYEYVPDMVSRRAPYREAHLAHIAGWHERGELVIAGAYGDPPSGALFAFAVDDRDRVDAFVASDPYVVAGLVTAHRIERWTVIAHRPLDEPPSP
jgi:uncharacterized protein